MKRIVTRGLVIAGWMLTPVAAWAVSFLGGWLGASVGGGGDSDTRALWMLAIGAVLGAVAGAAGWVLAMRLMVLNWIASKTSAPPGDRG